LENLRKNNHGVRKKEKKLINKNKDMDKMKLPKLPLNAVQKPKAFYDVKKAKAGGMKMPKMGRMKKM